MIKIMDLDDVKSRLNLELEEIREIYNIFLEESEDTKKRLKELSNERDDESLRKEIHMIKGIALNLGFRELYVKLAKYNECMKREKLDDKNRAVEDIIISIEMIKEEIKMI